MGGGKAEVVERYWYSIDWDVEALWALELPVEDFPVSELLWHLDVPLWPADGVGYRLSPRRVIAAPEIHRVEFDRMRAADARYPIEITYHLERWMILDGVHRLLKAFVAGAETIRVRKVPRKFLKVLDGQD